ncbi:winged helix-turn-helix transcriptional regulator [[Eubacterium] cellulosolvens]
MVHKGDFVFDHELRKMIYTHILTYPGVSYITLKNIFDLTNGTLRYHLDYLERADRIMSGVENGKRCYYPMNDDIEINKLFENRPRSFKLSVIQKRILNAIKHAPGITQKDLIKKTGLSRFTISYNMKKFIAMGLIRKSNSSKFVQYEYMTDAMLRHEVLVRLAEKLLRKEIDEKAFFSLKKKLGVV